MLKQSTYEELLDIEKSADLDPLEMARKMSLVVYPYDKTKISHEVYNFSQKLITALKELGVTFVPYEDALVHLKVNRIAKAYTFATYNSIREWINILLRRNTTENVLTLSTIRHMKFGKKIKKGISVLALGEHETGNLPMDNTMSFSETSVVSIVDRPENINTDSTFQEHFDTAMNLFTHHMTNIAIAVDNEKWILYNFNASHPTFKIDSPNFKKYLLDGLIPKIAAPIKPPKLKEFKIVPATSAKTSNKENELIRDLCDSGALLQKANLYPPGKSLASMNFRNEFYRWIGAIHLDQRNGMSYGFLARQLPVRIEKALNMEEAKKKYGLDLAGESRELIHQDGKLLLVIKPNDQKLLVPLPDVWVLTQRSGANKTNMNPDLDILKMGLVNGRLVLEQPRSKDWDKASRPSFDTRVILAHAIGNAIVASVLKQTNPESLFVTALENNGLAIAHWHGYINPEYVPSGWIVHGVENPHVSCSSPHSAIYAIDGKLKAFASALKNGIEYFGDIHIEPHHGTNINYWSLSELGVFFTRSNDVSTLGNKYLSNYKSE